ncbi:hypothetical protein [Weissella cibaria]|uniref:hypothetical protein n=1 Tax=Weissella cibaria TaxID=137591 RepID=UPI00106E0419|nr:hypothetical protein [Weissella cibaria]
MTVPNGKKNKQVLLNDIANLKEALRPLEAAVSVPSVDFEPVTNEELREFALVLARVRPSRYLPDEYGKPDEILEFVLDDIQVGKGMLGAWVTFGKRIINDLHFEIEEGGY